MNAPLDLDSLLDSDDDEYPLPNEGTPAIPSPAPKLDLFDLDNLLAESMAARSEAELVKENRRRLAQGKVSSSEERAAIQEQIRQWEARREWTPVADVVMFSRQQCQCCGSFSHHFLGYYQEQESRTSKVKRWIKSFKPTITEIGSEIPLPRESKYEDSNVDICHKCGDLAGWSLEED
jgi:hypothetical protein